MSCFSEEEGYSPCAEIVALRARIAELEADVRYWENLAYEYAMGEDV